MDWVQAFAFWRWGNDAFGTFHLVAAVWALAVGPLVLWMSKGDLFHRLLGMSYVIAMYITNLSALFMYTFTGGFNFFHIAALASLATLTLGFVAIIVHASNGSHRALDLHLQMMPWSYLGLVLAAVAESSVRGLPKLFEGATDMGDVWMRIFWIIGVSGVLGFVVTFVMVGRARRRWLDGQLSP